MKWVMLIYKLPRSRTTAKKVAIWRKLKKLGVYSVQDSMCVLPHSERSLENLEWLAAELREMGGEASLWVAETLTPSQEKEMREYFLEQVNVQYRKIMEESALAQTQEQLGDLWMQYNRIRAQDYLKSPLSMEARAAFEVKMRELREVGEKEGLG